MTDDTYEIKHLSSVPSHRNKGVEECLINLALKYCKTKSACKKVVVKFDEEIIREYQSKVLPSILTDKFGFK